MPRSPDGSNWFPEHDNALVDWIPLACTVTGTKSKEHPGVCNNRRQQPTNLQQLNGSMCESVRNKSHEESSTLLDPHYKE